MDAVKDFHITDGCNYTVFESCIRKEYIFSSSLYKIWCEYIYLKKNNIGKHGTLNRKTKKVDAWW